MNIVTPYRKLLVLSKSKAESFIHETPWACISIHDSYDNPAKINKVQQIDILQLGFDDINQPEEDLKLFTEEQAVEVLDFVEKVWDKIDLLMVHCYAGICRSPAIAAMISKIYYGDDLYFYQHYRPNSWVYQMIYRVAADRGDFNPRSEED